MYGNLYTYHCTMLCYKTLGIQQKGYKKLLTKRFLYPFFAVYPVSYSTACKTGLQDFYNLWPKCRISRKILINKTYTKHGRLFLTSLLIQCTHLLMYNLIHFKTNAISESSYFLHRSQFHAWLLYLPSPTWHEVRIALPVDQVQKSKIRACISSWLAPGVAI